MSNPLGGVDCDYVRTTRAFSIMALVAASVGFLLTWLGYNSYDDLMYRVPAVMCSLASMAFGLVAWAVWIAMSQRDFSTDWQCQ